MPVITAPHTYDEDSLFVDLEPIFGHSLFLKCEGFNFAGSTGTVVSGAMSWLAQHDGADLTAVAIAPDLGERYLDTVYQTNWLQDLYGTDVLRDVQTDRRRAGSGTPADDAVHGSLVRCPPGSAP